MRIRFWCSISSLSTISLSVLLIVFGQIEFTRVVDAQEILTPTPALPTPTILFINESELTLYPPSPTTTPTPVPPNLTPTLPPFPTMAMAVATPIPNSEPTLYMPPGVQALKITVMEEGIYELTRDGLAEAGFAVDVLDPAAIQLMHRGKQVAYQLVNDDGDGRFSPNETIRFYSWAFDGSRYEQFFVDEMVYWLWFDETATPHTIPIEPNPAANNSSAVHTFPESRHFEENNIYRSVPLTEEDFRSYEPDVWYWEQFGYHYGDWAEKTVTTTVQTGGIVEVYGSAAPNTHLSFLLYSLEEFLFIREERWSNDDGRWGIVFTPEDGAIGDEFYLHVMTEDDTPVTIELADGRQAQTKFYPAETYNLNLPHPAQTSRQATFTAEFVTRSTSGEDTHGWVFDSFSTEVILGNGFAGRDWQDNMYVGIIGNLANHSLTHGDNEMTIVGSNGQSLSGSAIVEHDPIAIEALFDLPRIWFNSVTVNYERELIAENNTLQFGHTELGQRDFYVRGLTEGNTADAVVWDVSNRLAPTMLMLGQSDIELDGETYRWRIGRSITAGQPLEMFVTTRSNIKSLAPEQLEPFMPTAINPNKGAEWVAITHRNFYTSTVALAEYRADMSELSTHIVDIEQIINQYGFGYHLPHAIQDYMRHAYTTWEMAPRYLLLVGDADYNMHGRPCDTCTIWSTEDETFITADHQFVDEFIGRLTTDHTYAMLDGDDLIPEIAVGRLPVQTAAELDTILNKMRIYEQAVVDEAAWVRTVLMLADNADRAGDFCDHAGQMDSLIGGNALGYYDTYMYCMDNYILNPDALTISSTVAIETFPTESDLLKAAKEEVRTQMFTHVNGVGSGIINYRGHGVIDAWGGGLLNMRSSFENNHIAQWQNENPAVIISADCLDTSFTRSGLPGLAETTLKLPHGGSVAHFGSTGLGYNSNHTRLIMQLYYGLIQEGGINTIGDAITYAKEQYIVLHSFYPYRDPNMEDEAQILSFTLLGDPALRLPTPPPRSNLFLPLITR